MPLSLPETRAQSGYNARSVRWMETNYVTYLLQQQRWDPTPKLDTCTLPAQESTREASPDRHTREATLVARRDGNHRQENFSRSDEAARRGIALPARRHVSTFKR